MSESLLSVTPADYAEPPRAAPDEHRPGVMLALAGLLHAAVLAAAIIHLPESQQETAPEMIPVEIVQLPEEEPQPETEEPAPEPEPELEPEPQPEPEQQQAPAQSRSSGASDDPQRPAGEMQSAEVEAEPQSPEAQETSEPAELPPELTLGPSPDQEVLEAMAQMREAFNVNEMERTGSLNSAGPGEGGGDPYLNAMRDRIIGNIAYPGAAGGRTGTATYRAVVTRNGALAKLELVSSAGAGVLDQAGLDAIRASAPFTPLPDYIPGRQAIISIVLNISP